MIITSDICRFRSRVTHQKAERRIRNVTWTLPVRGGRGGDAVISTNQRSTLIEFSSGGKRAKPEIQQISRNPAERPGAVNSTGCVVAYSDMARSSPLLIGI